MPPEASIFITQVFSGYLVSVPLVLGGACNSSYSHQALMWTFKRDAYPLCSLGTGQTTRTLKGGAAQLLSPAVVNWCSPSVAAAAVHLAGMSFIPL